ncbi:unnamed protein product [marine sediment metagenome]|uniref:Uncharacterized protein n=1 Tax=marine sediment metagenome TaxID=412755 RepID=X1BUT3_9ZZZZ
MNWEAILFRIAIHLILNELSKQMKKSKKGSVVEQDLKNKYAWLFTELATANYSLRKLKKIFKRQRMGEILVPIGLKFSKDLGGIDGVLTKISKILKKE